MSESFKQALANMAKATEDEAEFYKELFNTTFLCPAKEDVSYSGQISSDAMALQQEKSVEVMAFEDDDGMSYLAAFTDEEEMSKMDQAEDYVALEMNFAEYLDICNDEDSNFEGVVINPYGENITLEKELFQQVGEDEQILFSETEPTLETLKVILSEKFAAIKDIERAYAVWMEQEGNEGFLIVLDTGGIDIQKAVDVINATELNCLEGRELYMLPYEHDFGQLAIENVEPFYVK